MWLRIQKAIIWLTPNVSSLKKHSTWIRLAILAPLSPTLTTSHTLPTLPILAPALPTYCIHFKATELKRVGTRYQRHNFFERQNSKKKDCDLRSFFLKNGPSLASFSFISLQFLQKIFVKNVHPVNGTGIELMTFRTPPITTIPGLPTLKIGSIWCSNSSNSMKMNSEMGDLICVRSLSDWFVCCSIARWSNYIATTIWCRTLIKIVKNRYKCTNNFLHLGRKRCDQIW